MFTGIVQAVGKIERVAPAEGGVRLAIDASGLDLKGAALGASICIQGACMTVVEFLPGGFAVDVSRESLDCTVGLDRVGPVNLEPSLALGDELGGHLVTGHVDGIGEVTVFEQVAESVRFGVRAPKELGRYLARKGSVCVNGVSLTVNRVSDSDAGCEFEMNLIPHTLSVTTLGGLKAGEKVNLEVDLVARYVERMVG